MERESESVRTCDKQEEGDTVIYSGRGRSQALTFMNWMSRFCSFLLSLQPSLQLCSCTNPASQLRQMPAGRAGDDQYFTKSAQLDRQSGGGDVRDGQKIHRHELELELEQRTSFPHEFYQLD